VKRHNHIRSLLLPWIELSLNEQQQRRVEEHLKECTSCRQYYESMSHTLLPSEKTTQDTLEPDPFLPTRIRAMVDSSVAQSRQKTQAAVRWTLRTVMFAIAVGFGIFMGEQLSYRPPAVTDQNIITEYSEMLQVEGIADRLQSVTQTSAEESK
jgi:predicted anti-sigma-YlaC factor YlaD